jgi:hypothetical protein
VAIGGGYTEFAGFAVVHHKTVGYLVELQNQDRSLGGRRWDPGTPRSFEADDTRRDRKARVEARRGAVAGGIRPMVLRREFPKCPSGACILVLCNRDSFIFWQSPYILRGERMAAISRNPSSFGFPIFPFYFP